MSTRPSKIVCVGRSYADHAKELGNAVPDYPVLFIKPPSSLRNLSDGITWNKVWGNCHYECEDIATNHKDDQYVAYEAFINQMPVVQYDDFLGQIVYPINKCLIVGEPTLLHELELKLAKEVEGKMNVYRSATCLDRKSVV